MHFFLFEFAPLDFIQTVKKNLKSKKILTQEQKIKNKLTLRSEAEITLLFRNWGHSITKPIQLIVYGVPFEKWTFTNTFMMSLCGGSIERPWADLDRLTLSLIAWLCLLVLIVLATSETRCSCGARRAMLRRRETLKIWVSHWLPFLS